MPAETSRSVSLNVIANIGKATEELGKIPGVTEKQAARAALKLQNSFTAEAVKQFKEVEKQAAKTGGSYAALGKQIGVSVGGPLGRTTSMAIELAGKLTGVAGTFGAVVSAGLGLTAVAGVAGGVLVASLLKVASAASEAQDRLIKAGDAALLPAETRQEIIRYDEAMKQLTTSVDLFAASFGSELADDIGLVTFALIKSTDSATAGARAYDALVDAAFVMLSITSPMAAKAVADLVKQFDAERIAAQEMLNEAAAAREFKRTMEEATGSVHHNTTKTKDNTKALAQNLAARNAFAAAKLTAETQKSLDAETAASDEALRREKRDAAFRDAQRALRAQKDADALQQRKTLTQEWADTAIAAEQAVADVFASLLDRRSQLLQKELDKERNDADALAAHREDLQQKLKDADDEASKARIRARIVETKLAISAKQLEVKATKRHLHHIAQAQKALSILQATVNTGVAVTLALATIPPPFGLPASIAAGIAGGAQIAAIAAQPIPSFFRGTSRVPTQGGSPGAQQMTTHGNEAVLTDGAVDRLGRMLVDLLNGGGTPQLAGAGGGGGGIVLDSYQLDRALASRVRAGGALTLAVKGSGPTGYRSPFGRN